MDKRVEANRETKVRITYALVSLLASKKLSDISVTDIVERAGVARASYYRNFSSKEDVLAEAGRFIIDDFRRSISHVEGGCRGYEGILFAFRYFASYREPLLRLHRAGFTGIYEDLFRTYVEDEARDVVRDEFSRYRIAFFSSALFGFYVSWLENGMQESPEVMAKLFCSMASGAIDEAQE